MKATLSTEWLSGCSGCHVAMVDLHEKLIHLVEDISFVRIPVLMDERDYPQADVGLLEGAIRSAHDREAALKLRASVKTLIAFGSCAAFGGPSGLGWLYEPEAVLRTVYDEGPTNAGGERPGPGAPPLEPSVVPIDEVVQVDHYLPGCPPSPYFIAATLKYVLDGKQPPLRQGTVCTSCERKMGKSPGTALQKGAITAPDHQRCFLSQGVVCMGSVTMDRCLAPCPKRGVVCTGCNGPSLRIIQEPHLDLRTQVAERMHLLCGIPKEDIQTYLEQDAKTFYAYAMASPTLFRKPTVELREWAERP